MIFPSYIEKILDSDLIQYMIGVIIFLISFAFFKWFLNVNLYYIM